MNTQNRQQVKGTSKKGVLLTWNEDDKISADFTDNPKMNRKSKQVIEKRASKYDVIHTVNNDRRVKIINRLRHKLNKPPLFVSRVFEDI